MDETESVLEDDVGAEESFSDVWREAPVRRTSDATRQARRRLTPKPLRQRIEEYFEKKRLKEALDEEIDDGIFP